MAFERGEWPRVIILLTPLAVASRDFDTDVMEMLKKSADPLLNAHLDYYHAVALAYQGRTAEALAAAQRAEAAFGRLAPDAVARGRRAQLPRNGPGGAGVLRGAGIESLLSDDSPSTTEQRAAISGLAESMRLHATLLQLSGNTAESAALARRTQQILDANALSVSSTAARSFRLLASNEAIARDYPAAASSSRGTTSIIDGVRWQAALSSRMDAGNELVTLAFTKLHALIFGPSLTRVTIR